MAVKILSVTKSIHCVNGVTDGRLLLVSGCPLLPPPALRTHEPTPFSLQFFLFILLIFLAELSAAILAFIFRENVRTGSHAPWPLQSLAFMAKLPSSPRVSLSSSTSSPNCDLPSQGGPVA